MTARHYIRQARAALDKRHHGDWQDYVMLALEALERRGRRKRKGAKR